MCGIVGIGGPRGRELVAGCVGSLAHRGPDDEGSWADHRIALGHRRLTIIGLDFAAMLGNAFLVEAVYAWPGLSRYGVQVILRKDLNAIVGTVLVISAAFLIVNIIVDLLIAYINPRIRLAEKGRP